MASDFEGDFIFFRATSMMYCSCLVSCTLTRPSVHSTRLDFESTVI